MLPSSSRPARVFRQPSRLALVALFLGVAGIGAAVVFGWAQYHLWAVQRALDRYAFDEAQHHLDLYFKVRSGDAAVHVLAAQTARRRDAYDEAEQHLASALQQGGLTETIALERSLLAAQQGNLDNVERSLLGRTGTDYPEAVLVLEALAKGYANRYRHNQVLVCLNILLDREPRHPQAWLMRARAWEDRAAHGEKERDQDALRDYEKAVELYPTFDARLGLAGTLYRVGRPHDALIQYEQLQQVQPANSEVILGLARCRYSLHEVDEARRLLDGLLAQHPDHAGALLERGRLALHEVQLAEAEQWLRQADALAPRYDCDAVRVLARCLEAANKTEEASRCGEELARREGEVLEVARLTSQATREPENLPLRYEIAQKMLRLGREQDAVTTFWLVVEQDPRYAPAHQALADYYERAGQPARASRHRRLGSPARSGGPTGQ